MKRKGLTDTFDDCLPGTKFHQPAAVAPGAPAMECSKRVLFTTFQDTEPNDAITPCYYETFIKGSSSENVVFSHEVHDAFRDVDIEVNRSTFFPTGF